MNDSEPGPHMDMQLGIDKTSKEEYAYQSNLLQEFTNISNIDNAWLFKTNGCKYILLMLFFLH